MVARDWGSGGRGEQAENRGFLGSEMIHMKHFFVSTLTMHLANPQNAQHPERTLIAAKDYGQKYTKVSSFTVTMYHFVAGC